VASRVLVTGATGTLGRQFLPRLIAAGCGVRALSRRPRPARDFDVDWVVADLRSGGGLGAVLAGTDLVVHCASAPRGDETAARNLIDAARRAGSPHIVYVSIIGCDRIPLGYYQSKRACEQLLERSGLPVTILRATQFHDLIRRLFTAQRCMPGLIVPSRTRFQPTDAGEVADHLIGAASDEPGGRLQDLGGPEVIDAVELARRYLRATRRRRAVASLRVPGEVGAALRAGANLAPEHADGRITFERFLAASRE
jgi:uncharacterized protein YbjT (DUF2867 family)